MFDLMEGTLVETNILSGLASYTIFVFESARVIEGMYAVRETMTRRRKTIEYMRCIVRQIIKR